jgi:CxxC motif-containing protein (DUF1111 family)
MNTRNMIALALCFLVPFMAVSARDDGYKVMYDGGSLGSIKSGTHMRLLFNQDKITVAEGNTVLVRLPPSAITEISYGQDVHRRVGAAIGLAVVSFGIGALMALTKSKKHFVGLTWTMDDGKGGQTKGGFAMQCDKNDYRGILAGLEGVTGKKAVDSEAMTVKN